jgi:hypothetical protein
MATRYILLLFMFISCVQTQDCCVPGSGCSLEPDPGPCRALITKYYYDKNEEKCKSFSWGGCQGSVPFETLEECLACEDQ